MDNQTLKTETSNTINKDFQILLDSKYYLLSEFREKCPGTYKHSQFLESMIESMGIDLGLDVDFMKVAAIYHDIGKIFNPKCFSENQLDDENLHNDLLPNISYELITRHVSDSIVILVNDNKFTRKLLEVISQHHGTTILRYFINKPNNLVIDSGLFRYKTSKPNSIEAMLLMICDQIEATSRSTLQSGKFNSSKIIEDTINYLINDGQLDNVVLKLGNLKKIKESLIKELIGFHQKRMDYDVNEDSSTE